MKRYLTLILLALSTVTTLKAKSDPQLTMLVGTYTDGGSRGVYSMRFDEHTGNYEMLDSIAITNPSYLALSSNKKYVYAVSEGGSLDSRINALKFNAKDGSFKLLSRVGSMGTSPCYVTTIENGVVVANYGDGVLSVFNSEGNGKINYVSQTMSYETRGPVAGRQDGAHLHCAVASRDMKYLFATNLGGDCIYQYYLYKNGDEVLLRSKEDGCIRVAAGSGPRHLEFAPDGRNAYLVNELSGTVTAFHYDGETLREFQTVEIDSLKAGGSGDIHLSGDGRYLYASNRLKGDGLAIMSISDDGSLTKIGYQNTKRHPRNFIITPNGQYLLVACRDDNTIQIFARDENSGMLTDTGKEIRISKPVCIKFAD